MKSIMLIYPPGELYQRGEDRCQLNISKSSANAMRACNDLGYASSVLGQRGYNIFLKDYQSEKCSLKDLFKDIDTFKPQIIFISTTNATIFYDLNIIKEIKNTYSDIVFILKGAIFHDMTIELLNKYDFSVADYMIGGEEEFIIGNLVDFHFSNKDLLETIPGIIYKKDNEYIITKKDSFCENLDSLPFPDRSKMNNKLYTMPDTGEPLATISTARGCPSTCIFCLSPYISGQKVRFRSPQNILEEMEECFYKYKIKNFFFKADTFTINKQWTIELCNKILNSNLAGQVRWVANSRVDTVDEEVLSIMKKTGCFLIAFGLESGSDVSLKKMKKNTSIKKNYNTVQLAKKIGLQTLGFYVIGFPWETKEDLEKTRIAMLKNDTDFIELHIATPFVGTELYDMLNLDNKVTYNILGKSHFNCINSFENDLTAEYVEKFRKKTVLGYYCRPEYIIKKIGKCILKPKIILNYLKYGFRLLKNSLLG